jgi:hypothetical protein
MKPTTTTPARPGNVLPINSRLAVVRPPAPLDGVAVSEFSQVIEWVSISATIPEKHAAAFEAAAHFRPDWFSTAFESYATNLSLDLRDARRTGAIPARCDTYRLDSLLWTNTEGQELRGINLAAKKQDWQQFLDHCATLALEPLAMIRAAMAARAKELDDYAQQINRRNAARFRIASR